MVEVAYALSSGGHQAEGRQAPHAGLSPVDAWLTAN